MNIFLLIFYLLFVVVTKRAHKWFVSASNSCDSGRCINKQWRCDREDDCGDESDERACPRPSCSQQQFLCGSKQCIEKIWRCDGQKDCADASDEIGKTLQFPHFNRIGSHILIE